MSDLRKMMCVWKRTRQWCRRRSLLTLLSVCLLRCSLAAILLLSVALIPGPRLGLMIRCSGLLMGLWMFLPAWHGRKRNWRPLRPRP